MFLVDFQKGKTLVRIDPALVGQSKRLRRRCKQLRRALGVDGDAVVEITVRRPAPPIPPAAAPAADVCICPAHCHDECCPVCIPGGPGTTAEKVERGDLVGVREDGRVARWPLSHAVPVGSPPVTLDIGDVLAYRQRLAEQIHATATPVDLRTYGDLSRFIQDFTGPTSAVPANATVNDLVRSLNASSYQTVSAAIHKIGPLMSARVEFFLEFLDESPAVLIPESATP